ncbi:MAG: hypothetical protein HYY20_07105 [Candidatus Tectomicrobia bacterium]|uniref:Tetratricopeptide repeat protein n=1 Tax=Tectimicrobiota bacterium TaxID=2528274 RepID=A0A932CNH0_UNCTE|nr:hypothetical protein [Candidatus Tectomicrobia bacterium]
MKRWGVGGIGLLVVIWFPGPVFPSPSGNFRATDPLASPFAERPMAPPASREAETTLKEAMEAALVGDWARVEQSYLSWREGERQGKKGVGKIPGLAANLLDLMSLQWKDRDAYIVAQQETLETDPDPALERLILKRLQEDELNEADHLLREDRSVKIGKFYNIFAFNLNVLNGFGWADLATAPLGAAPKVGERVFSFLGDLRQFFRELNQINPRERKALHLYDTFLHRWPQSPEAVTVEARAEKLRQKMGQYLFKRQLQLAREALREGDPHRGLYHSRKALELYPESEEAHQRFEAARKRERSLQEELQQSELISPRGVELQQPPKVQQAYQEILYALTIRDAKRLKELSWRFSQEYANNPLADDARGALALAYEWEGNPRKSRQILESLMAKKGESNMALHAQALLNDPGYDPYFTFETLRKGEYRSTWEYILLGKRLDFAWDVEDWDLFDIARDSLSLTNRLRKLNPNRMLRRAFDLFVLRKSLNNSALIAMGEFYVTNHPSTTRTAEVHRVLAEAYEKKKDYHRALLHYKKSGHPAPNKAKELEEKGAEYLLQLAQKSRDEGERAFYYSSLLQLYPASASARKMLDQQKAPPKDLALAREEWIGRAYLERNPILSGPQGLNLKEALFDHDLSNGELSRKGIAFPAPDRIKVAYLMADGRLEEREYPVTEDLLVRFSALLWETNYEGWGEGNKGLDEGLVRLLTQYEEKGLFRLTSSGLQLGGLPDLAAPPKSKQANTLRLELELLSPDQVSHLDSGDQSPMMVGSKTHPLPGLLVNLDVKGNKDKDQPDQIEILGRPVAMRGQVQKRDYVFDYRFWESNQFAAGKLYYSPWDTQGKLGLSRKGPVGELVFPIPFLKRRIPLVLDIKAQPKGIQVLPIIIDPGIRDEELYRD